jgi:hypothetical protein
LPVQYRSAYTPRRTHDDVGPFSIKLKPAEARAVRLYLELVAKRFEKIQCNTSYACAYKQAARIIRQMKPD